MWYHYIPTRLGKMKKSWHYQGSVYQLIGAFIHYCKTFSALWKIIWSFLVKVWGVHTLETITNAHLSEKILHKCTRETCTITFTTETKVASLCQAPPHFISLIIHILHKHLLGFSMSLDSHQRITQEEIHQKPKELQSVSLSTPAYKTAFLGHLGGSDS